MNKWLKILILLGGAVLGIGGIIYFWREIFILIKGILGFIAITLIVLIVISLWEKVYKS